MYFVSRQHYWHSGEHAVEIVSGGRDDASADMLMPYYMGEGEEFDDPREAARVAISIYNRWQHDDPSEAITLAGFTSGYGLCETDRPLTPQEVTEWAEKEYSTMPKCDRCGDILGRDRYGNEFTIMVENEYPFCSAYCAEESAREFQDEMTTAIHCTACDATLPKDTTGWCDACGADYEHLERVY